MDHFVWSVIKTVIKHQKHKTPVFLKKKGKKGIFFSPVHQYIGVLLACAASSASLHSRKSEFPSCMDIYRTKHGTGKLLEAAEKKKQQKEERQVRRVRVPQERDVWAWGEQVMWSTTLKQVVEDEWWAASEARGQSPAQSRWRRRVVSEGCELCSMCITGVRITSTCLLWHPKVVALVEKFA